MKAIFGGGAFARSLISVVDFSFSVMYASYSPGFSTTARDILPESGTWVNEIRSHA